MLLLRFVCPQVVDVGGGTGFCTLGIVQTVKPENVTMCDQSPHQLAKAKAKPALKGVTILEVGPGWEFPTCAVLRGDGHSHCWAGWAQETLALAPLCW